MINDHDIVIIVGFSQLSKLTEYLYAMLFSIPSTFTHKNTHKKIKRMNLNFTLKNLQLTRSSNVANPGRKVCFSFWPVGHIIVKMEKN